MRLNIIIHWRIKIFLIIRMHNVIILRVHHIKVTNPQLLILPRLSRQSLSFFWKPSIIIQVRVLKPLWIKHSRLS